MGTAGAPARIVVLDSDDNIVSVGDLVNSAIRVNVVAGSSGGGAVTQGTVPWIVDGSGVVQPISGTVAVSGSVAVTGSFFQATQPISAVALPLPTGASTEATLAALNAKVTAVNTGAVVITSGVITSITNPVAVTQSGAWSAGRTWALSSGTDSVAVSGAVTVSATNLDIRDLVFASDKVDVSGSAVTVTGTVTANAGTNLNTSLLALEAGGNLATIAAKDFATQTTLALIKAKTDNLDVTLSGGGTHVIVDTMPPVTAESSATATVEAPVYTEGVSEALSQDLAGNLRTRVAAVVSESPQSYIDGEVRSLSLNSEGRLRVSAVPAPDYIEFFIPFDFGQNIDIRELSTSPWSALS